MKQLFLFFLFFSSFSTQVFAQEFFTTAQPTVTPEGSNYTISFSFDMTKHGITNTIPLSTIYVSGGVYIKDGVEPLITITSKQPDTNGLFRHAIPSGGLNPNTEYRVTLTISGGGKTETLSPFVFTTQKTATPIPSLSPNNPNRYDLLAPIPGLTAVLDPVACKEAKSGEEICDINQFINFMLKLIIGICAVILVVRLIIAGYAYMTTDVPFVKFGAKNTFYDALIGLLVALSSYLILNTINPRLVNNSFSLQQAAFNVETFEDIEGEAETTISGKVIKITKSKIIYQKQFTNKTACAGEKGTQQNPDNTTCSKYNNAITRSASGAYVEKTFAEKLSNFNTILKSKNIPWKITEAWPQSRTHKAVCHQIGLCVDMNHTTNSGGLTPNLKPSLDEVKTVIETAKSLGMCAQYEILNDRNLYQQIVNAGYGKNVIFFNGKWISANHYSLYNGTCL